MSATVRLSGKLPGEPEINGLDSLAEALKKDPHKAICAIVWLDVAKITRDVDAEEEIPTVRVRRIEPIGTLDKVPDEIIKLNAELNERRTGRKPLPFDVLDYEDQGYVDPE